MSKIDEGHEYYKNLFRKDLIYEIMQVVNGERPSCESHLHFPLWSICDVLEEFGFKQDEMDSNGWQFDYWHTFDYQGKSYTVYGSAYYGGFSFYPSEK